MRITNLPSGALQANTYLAVDEKTNEGFIVDPGGYNKVLTKEVRDNDVKIKYIILTHGHSDHICGVNEHKAEFPDAKIVAYKDEEAMLENPNLNQSPGFGVPYSTKADILVSDGDELKVGDVTLKFIHTPGHTEGGMCIYVKEVKALFSGDTLFRQSIGRTDFPGGSYKEIMDSIRKKLFLLPDDTNVFPGHMGMTSIGFEKENNPFV
ncbi:MAG: MBL fold metallo-hydrolase [Clostridia bacterium]